MKKKRRREELIAVMMRDRIKLRGDVRRAKKSLKKTIMTT